MLTPLPEEVVRHARPGGAFVVLTHDHALDFLIVREALARDDAAYVGMIGSKTKLVSFRRWLKQSEEPAPDIGPLVCPIGAAGRPDKRPEVIAAFVGRRDNAERRNLAGANARRPTGTPEMTDTTAPQRQEASSTASSS